jgi:RpiR family transcriptional regulator, carbohydrate utilization regulator
LSTSDRCAPVADDESGPKALDIGALGRAVAAIRLVFGIGSAATIAEDANHRPLPIGVNSRV